MISLQDAVQDLHRVAIVENKRQSNERLARLARMCIEQLDKRGIMGATAERKVPGIGRDKQWDVAWPREGRVRLGVSLKSILTNLSGNVPNRIDDLMGEMANVQLRSPEITLGYVMVIDVGSGIREHSERWAGLFREAAARLSGRDAPAWAPGMVEATAVIEVDLSEGARIVREPDMPGFFNRLADCVRTRNPGMPDLEEPQ